MYCAIKVDAAPKDGATGASLTNKTRPNITLSFATSRMLLILFLLSLVSICHAVPHTSLTRERAQLRDIATQLFLAQDWKNLESGAARFRQPTERFLNGEWKLPIFYSGVQTGF